MVQHQPSKDMEGDLDDMDEDLDARFWEPHGTARGDGTPCAGQELWTMSAMSAVGCPGGGKDADLPRDGVEPRWEE